MSNKSSYNRTRLKSKLPLHDAPDHIWNNIESHFNLREKDNADFSSFKKKLPVHEPGDDVWANIENTLGREKKVPLRMFSTNYLKVAASLLILVALSVFVTWYVKPSKENIYYSYEDVSASLSDEYINKQVESDQLAKLVNNICDQNGTFCQTDIYIELSGKLEYLEAERNKINESYMNNRSNQLLKYLNTIDNQKIELQRKILQYSNNI